ncbi:OsmC family protein [Microbulbifer zhoushanensis]|uniref:OsmC family protein n=1 Tax=Microbulbifer TaxID=48073 RepID=UPI001F2CC83F|nr:OsmC family protein [Microbulbifer zhoushanensis]
MQELPHQYRVAARADPGSDVELSTDGVEPLTSAPPVQFGGPGDHWSPEDLLVAALADCFILTFRAIATFKQLEWHSLACEANGTLDRRDRKTQFTAFTISAELEIPAGGDTGEAERLLHKAEERCLVTNSLVAGVTLEVRVRQRQA